jgi:NitT/TauT family transport system ATP-binding protein
MIELRDVGFEYLTTGRRTPAVHEVSLRVPRGASVAFVGASGCGKSTLLKLIAGLVTATRGVVTVDGRPVVAPLKNVGMAFQNPVLLPWRSVLDNLYLPLEILRENGDRRAVDRAQWRKRALDLLDTVGLAGAEHRQPRELSGGMRQRVSLCRALIHAPELLLLDEPFAALDAFTRLQMGDLLRETCRDRSRTVLLVTHDVDEALRLADRIVLLGGAPAAITAEYATAGHETARLRADILGRFGLKEVA